MALLTVISGGMDTGKSLISEALMSYTDYVLIARDAIRPTFGRQVDEWQITQVMFSMAATLLSAGNNVLAVAWNLEPEDRTGWLQVASQTQAQCRWIHVEVPG